MIILYKTCTCHLLHTLKDTTTPVLCLLHASHTIHFSHKRKHFSHKSECFWHGEIHFLQGTKWFPAQNGTLSAQNDFSFNKLLTRFTRNNSLGLALFWFTSSCYSHIVVAPSNTWVSAGYSSFLPHQCSIRANIWADVKTCLLIFVK